MTAFGPNFPIHGSPRFIPYIHHLAQLHGGYTTDTLHNILLHLSSNDVHNLPPPAPSPTSTVQIHPLTNPSALSLGDANSLARSVPLYSINGLGLALAGRHSGGYDWQVPLEYNQNFYALDQFPGNPGFAWSFCGVPFLYRRDSRDGLHHYNTSLFDSDWRTLISDPSHGYVTTDNHGTPTELNVALQLVHGLSSPFDPLGSTQYFLNTDNLFNMGPDNDVFFDDESGSFILPLKLIEPRHIQDFLAVLTDGEGDLICGPDDPPVVAMTNLRRVASSDPGRPKIWETTRTRLLDPDNDASGSHFHLFGSFDEVSASVYQAFQMYTAQGLALN